VKAGDRYEKDPTGAWRPSLVFDKVEELGSADNALLIPRTTSICR
jgi:hypothetical protein